MLTQEKVLSMLNYCQRAYSNGNLKIDGCGDLCIEEKLEVDFRKFCEMLNEEVCKNA